jgi:hypothetical protein
MPAKNVARVLVTALTAVVWWSAPSTASAATRASTFSPSFCQDVAGTYASPTYVASHWPTLHSPHPSKAQVAEFTVSLDLLDGNGFHAMAVNAPIKYVKALTAISSAAENEWSTAGLMSAISSPPTAPRALANDVTTIENSARVVQRDLAAIAPEITQGCSTFNDIPTLSNTAALLTERAQNVAESENTPFSVAVINYTITTYPHLTSLVKVWSAGHQLTKVQYKIASITGTVTACTNVTGYFKDPVAEPC